MRIAAYKVPVRSPAGTVYAYVDPEDRWATEHKWYLVEGYASRRVDGTTSYLHRFIAEAPSGMQVDHIDRNKLNDRRSNLRVLTNAENKQNRGSHRGSSSKYRGVCVHSPGKWMARMQLNYKQHYIGLYDSEEEAAEAAREYRQRHMPYATN